MTAEWLPVVDNLERALEHAVVNPEAVVEGLEAVRDQAVATLDRLGYPRYDDVGHPFNPERDEAVGTTVAAAPEGTVVVAVRPGYGTSENILRPAAVDRFTRRRLMAEAQDFYEVLGVGRDATAQDIQRAYRKLARTYHPDVNKDPAAERRFQEISEAYEVLSDPESRRRYDVLGPDFRQVPPDVDPETWARARARSGARPRRTAAGDEDVWVSSGFSGVDFDIDDLLGGMFGGGRRPAWGRTAGADQEAEVVLSVENAYSGGRRSITVAGASGPRTFEVTIPAGVTEGQRIRLAGQGGQGSGGGPPGDLYLVVHLAPHPRYRLDGRDLYVDLPLSPWEAALGASVAIGTPEGEAKVRVKAGTSSGARLRLRGRGLPNPRGNRGDLFAEVKIMVPRSLSKDERRLFEELAATSNFDPRRGK